MTEIPVAPTFLPYVLFALTWAVLWLLLSMAPDGLRLLKMLALRIAPRLMARPLIAQLIDRGRARMTPLQAYLPTMAILALGIGATLMIGEDFIELAASAQAESPAVIDIDQTVYTWASSMRSPGSTSFFVAFTLLGTPVGLAIVTAIATAVLLARRHRGRTFYLIITSVVGGLLNLALKGMFARARPDLTVALRQAHGYSFPSGHAMGSMIVLGALAYVVSRTHYSWRSRSAAMALLLTTVLTIGLSRIYLGVHWISDIVAGYAAGLIWVIVATVAFEAFWRIRQIRAGRAEEA